MINLVTLLVFQEFSLLVGFQWALKLSVHVSNFFVLACVRTEGVRNFVSVGNERCVVVRFMEPLRSLIG